MKRIALLCGLLFFTHLIVKAQIQETRPVEIKEAKDVMRILISTSGPVEFSSHWLEQPYRLVVEFQSMNVTSQIDNEVFVNQGVIKKITSSYFTGGKTKSLKTLTFELSQKVLYKIWQEGNSIILDIEALSEMALPTKMASSETVGIPMEGREIFVKSETGDVIIKRLEAMDTALTQLDETVSKELLSPVTTDKVASKIVRAEEKIVTSKEESVIPEAKTSPLLIEVSKSERKISGAIFWFASLVITLGLGSVVWRRRKFHTDKQLEKLQSELKEKNKRLEQEEDIRKAIEAASLQKDKEYEEIKNNFESLGLEIQKRDGLLAHEENVRKQMQKTFTHKDEEYQELKKSFESLKEILIKKGLAKELSSPKEKEALWIPGESKESRLHPRLSLTKDYTRTIILRIESQTESRNIKCFARNISLGGLCFETTRDFNEKDSLNLRLFFYGGKVPIIKVKADIIWKREVGATNHYGICFNLIDEKNKTELSRYLQTNLNSYWSGTLYLKNA